MATSNKLSKDVSNLIGIYLLVGIVAAVLAWLFLFSKQLGAITENRNNRSAVVAEIEELEALGEATEVLRENYQQIAADRDAILNLLPANVDSEHLLLLLSQYAQSNQVILTSFSPETALLNEDSGQGFVGYPTQINIIGKYSNILSFIRSLETGARYVDINTFNLASSDVDATNPDLEVTLEITAYYQTASSSLNTDDSSSNGSDSGDSDTSQARR